MRCWTVYPIWAPSGLFFHSSPYVGSVRFRSFLLLSQNMATSVETQFGVMMVFGIPNLSSYARLDTPDETERANDYRRDPKCFRCSAIESDPSVGGGSAVNL